MLQHYYCFFLVFVFIIIIFNEKKCLFKSHSCNQISYNLHLMIHALLKFLKTKHLILWSEQGKCIGTILL